MSDRDLPAGDLRSLLALIEGTVGLGDVEAFREEVFRRLHAVFDIVSTLFYYHLGDGRPRAIPSRLQSEEEFRLRDAVAFEEHRGFLDGALETPSLAIATRDIPERHYKSMATIQTVWPRWGMRESVIGRFRGASSGADGLLIATFDDRRSRQVARCAAFFDRLRRYVGHMMDHYAHLDRLGVRLRVLDDVASCAEPMLLVGLDGRVEYMTDAATRLFLDLTGSADPPPALLELAARAYHALAHDIQAFPETARERTLALGSKEILARAKVVGGDHGAGVLLMLDDPARRRRQAIVAQGRVLGLTAREGQVAELVCRGCQNKQIARELGISSQTVANHLKRIFAKAGVGSRTGLTDRMLRP